MNEKIYGHQVIITTDDYKDIYIWKLEVCTRHQNKFTKKITPKYVRQNLHQSIYTKKLHQQITTKHVHQKFTPKHEHQNIDYAYDEE